MHLVGLCNLVAGALLACRPTLVLPLDGVQSPAGVVLTRGLAVVLVAIAVAGWSIPDNALRAFLWIFGVGVKGLGAALWGVTAATTGAGVIGAGASMDAAVAVLIAWTLTSGRVASLEQPVDGHARGQDRHTAE